MYKLSICIPTYNRAKYLKENLAFLLPQIKNKDNVEVVVINNDSEDNTNEVVEEYVQKHKNIRYYKNPTNLGYSGNQLKCFEYAQGEYCAILSDDDVYLDGAVELILKHIYEKEYVFLALNYCGFIKNPLQPYKSNFAPKRDVIFNRAYDIMNYPSVGHFSGFIFNSKIARETLKDILNKRPIEYYEKYRGIITDLAVRMTTSSNLPSCFIGEIRLANRYPDRIDYDMINHQCIDYYEYYKNLYDEGIINKSDLKYREKLVLSLLPRAIFRDIPYMSKNDINIAIKKLRFLFEYKLKFFFISLPLLNLSRIKLLRYLYLYIYKLKHIIIE
ncbi:MAG: glycosyltransferase family 2 protein [Stygiobacter sp.]